MNDEGSILGVSGGGVAAKHPSYKIQPVLVGPTSTTLFNTVKEHLHPVACLRLNNSRFEFDSSFISDRIRKELQFLAKLRRQTPGMTASVFAHADPVGDDEYNKQLSGRRAQAIYGLLTRRTELWTDLYDNPVGGDKWGYASLQLILGTLGFYDGPVNGVADEQSREAVEAFQSGPDGSGLEVDGEAGAQTRPKLFLAYMNALCVDENESPYQLSPSTDFLAGGLDSKGKGDYQGCSEFNPVLLFSQSEDDSFREDPDKTDRNAQNGPNRRVIIFLFRPGLQIAPGTWPCPTVKEGVALCQARFFSDYKARLALGPERREYEKTRDTFACRFYDRFARRSPCEARTGVAVFRILNGVTPLPGLTLTIAGADGSTSEYVTDETGSATVQGELGEEFHLKKVTDGSGEPVSLSSFTVT